MKYLVFILISLISWTVSGQSRIHELPEKTNADSTWLILTGNPSTGRLYKMNFDNLKDSIIGTTDATDTTSLSNRIDLKLNATDTASLSSRIDAISSGGGGGEDIDSTLSIGNETDGSIIFNNNLGASPSTTTYEVFNIAPLQDDPGQADFKFKRGTYLQNAGATINNEVLWFGFNTDGATAGKPGIYEAWESSYYPDAGSSQWVEKHEIYRKPEGDEVRLSSYTINTGARDIDFYHTVNSFEVKDTVGSYFAASANIGTKASSLSVGATNSTAGLSIQTNGTDNTVSINSVNNTSNSELQFSAFELINFTGNNINGVGDISLASISPTGSYLNLSGPLNIIRNPGSVATLNFSNNILNTQNYFYISGDMGSGEFRFWASSGGFYPTFYSNGSEAMRISSTQSLLIGTTTNEASSILTLSSTSKGFLPPRMSAAQAGAISSPAEGLMVYVTDTDGTFTAKGWWGYDGSAWQKLNN